MKLSRFDNLISIGEKSDKMPALFVGHGNPMNAIEDNDYSKSWKTIGAKLGNPNAILCISAHWLTNGTFVHTGSNPRTIHDFGGFPDELFAQQYSTPGAVEIANSIVQNLQEIPLLPDKNWGLDHGTWSVLKNMYPLANVPVFQMSIDFGKPPEYHFELAKKIKYLRNKGVLIIGSGNVTHNLSKLGFNLSSPFDWAESFDNFVKTSLEEQDHSSLVNFHDQKEATIAHPSIDHYLPLLYTLGIQDSTDELTFFNETFDLGSISMRSYILQ